jgi:hypothetical protein
MLASVRRLEVGRILVLSRVAHLGSVRAWVEHAQQVTLRQSMPPG